MPTIDSETDDDLTEFQHPRGVLIFGGFLFLAMAIAGLAMVGTAFTKSSDPAALAQREAKVLFWAGLTIAVLSGSTAAFFLTSRMRVSILDDAIRRDWSFLGSTRSKSLPIDGRGLVTVDRQSTATPDGSSVSYWPVTYVHPEGAIELRRLDDVREGRRQAERIATHLDVALVDAAYGRATLRERGELDVAARDLALPGAGDDGDESDPWSPPSKRIVVRPFEDGVRIDIAPAGMSGSVVFGLMLFTLMASVVVRLFGKAAAGASDFPMAWVIGGSVLSSVFAAMGLRIVWLAFRHRESWSVTPDGVSALGRSASSRNHMEGAELEVVTLNDARDAVILVNDDRALELGHDLSNDEAESLKELVLRGLRGVD